MNVLSSQVCHQISYLRYNLDEDTAPDMVDSSPGGGRHGGVPNDVSEILSTVRRRNPTPQATTNYPLTNINPDSC